MDATPTVQWQLRAQMASSSSPTLPTNRMGCAKRTLPTPNGYVWVPDIPTPA